MSKEEGKKLDLDFTKLSSIASSGCIPVAVQNIDKWYKEFSHQIDYNKIRTFDYIEETLKGIVNSGGQNFIFTPPFSPCATILSLEDDISSSTISEPVNIFNI